MAQEPASPVIGSDGLLAQLTTAVLSHEGLTAPQKAALLLELAHQSASPPQPDRSAPLRVLAADAGAN